jgi:hypothetical protein
VAEVIACPQCGYREPGRSLEQNAKSHVWYAQIARELKEDSADGVKAECKLRFGVPILRGESADFCKMYDAVIKGHDYLTKLEVMRYLPVTSLMSIDQLNRYMTAIERTYAERGVALA